MRKGTIFISSVLTTFALVMLYGVVSAYQSMSKLPEAAPLPTNTATATSEPDPTLAPTSTQATAVSPQQAAQIAAQVVGNQNLLSAESSSVNGTNAYKITFTNNDVVYVGLDGQILSVQIAPAVVNVSAPVVQPVKHKKNNSNSGSSISSSTSSQSNEGEPGAEHDN